MNKLNNEIKFLSKFLLAGLFNMLLGWSLISLFIFLGNGPYLSNAISYGIGFIVSFILNKHYVFSSSGKRIEEVIKFLFSIAIAYSLNLVALHMLIQLSVNIYYGQLLAALVYSGSMYLLSRLWIFAIRH